MMEQIRYKVVTSMISECFFTYSRLNKPWVGKPACWFIIEGNWSSLDNTPHSLVEERKCCNDKENKPWAHMNLIRAPRLKYSRSTSHSLRSESSWGFTVACYTYLAFCSWIFIMFWHFIVSEFSLRAQLKICIWVTRICAKLAVMMMGCFSVLLCSC